MDGTDSDEFDAGVVGAEEEGIGVLDEAMSWYHWVYS